VLTGIFGQGIRPSVLRKSGIGPSRFKKQIAIEAVGIFVLRIGPDDALQRLGNLGRCLGDLNQIGDVLLDVAL